MGASAILVIHPGALGDVLQAVPALRALRRAGGHLTLAGQPRLATLLLGTGAAQAALGFDGLGLEALFTREPLSPAVKERLARFQRLVSWFGSRHDIYRERLSEISRECIVAPPVPEAGARLTVWRHLLDTLAPWGIGADADTAPLEPPEPWRDAARRTLAVLGAQRGRPLLVVHPGAGGSWKRTPAALLAEAIRSASREREVDVLIHQGPADRQPADELAAAFGKPTLHLVEPELPLLAGVLSECAVFVGGDSGVSHLAAAVGAPAVIVFPSTTRAQWEPWNKSAMAIEAGDEAGWVDAVREALRSRLGAGPAPRDVA
ncbi:MAG TPA: glycosyltransferase family 9 protein [Methylomirabilota bacterium]|nr:glycosyltransferase family 9 protein [Methylomirabilota bacterium]